MWLRTGRDTKVPARILGIVLATTAVAFVGCNADYVENSQAPVLMQIISINEGAQLDSDVRNGEFSSFVCENEVDVQVRVINKNPNSPAAAASDVLLESYEVKYTRSDGRGTEGVDVPYRITGNLAFFVEAENDATFPLEVVRRQAKLDPPLTNISQTTILTVSAQVTVYGKTTADKRVSATARFQIDFADFGDLDTNCPTN
jgi:hypothetical protein